MSDINLHYGSAEVFRLELSAAEGLTTLAGMTVRFLMRRRERRDTPIDVAATIIDEPNRIIEVSLTAVQTQLQPSEHYVAQVNVYRPEDPTTPYIWPSDDGDGEPGFLDVTVLPSIARAS